MSVVRRCRSVLIRRFGGPDVLEFYDMEIPHLFDGDVLVRTRAFSVNTLDTKIHTGFDLFYRRYLPMILGRDVSGEVAEIRRGVRHLKVGDEVFGALPARTCCGTYSNYVTFKPRDLILKPKCLSHVEAAALPYACLTAWRAFRRIHHIGIPHRILVIGGERGVGFAAIQLAKLFGGKVSTVCNSNTIAVALAAGAEQAVAYEDFEGALTGPFDIILDTLGYDKWKYIGEDFIENGGHYIILQDGPGYKFQPWRIDEPDGFEFEPRIGSDDGRPLFPKMDFKRCIERYPFTPRPLDKIVWHSYVRNEVDVEGLIWIRLLSGDGLLRIPIAKTYPMTEIMEAHKYKEEGSSIGKVVIEVD